MSIRQFVSGSSVILAGWLGATFLNEVPAQRYPKLDNSSPSTAMNPGAEKTVVSGNGQMAFVPAVAPR